MKHRLVIMGHLGVRIAFLDVPRHEAERRYRADHFDEPPVDVQEIEFVDTFGVYDAWPTERVEL